MAGWLAGIKPRTQARGPTAANADPTLANSRTGRAASRTNNRLKRRDGTGSVASLIDGIVPACGDTDSRRCHDLEVWDLDLLADRE
jgi:hypothetical protein